MRRSISPSSRRIHSTAHARRTRRHGPRGLQRRRSVRYNPTMLMTGPALRAWFIGSLLLCISLPWHAHAATPRDAVQLMPSITHSSTFTLVEQDSVSGHGFEDNYFDSWNVRWVPPSVALGDKAKAGIELYYTSSLKDNLNRIAGSSSDSRSDKYNFVTTLKAPYFSARYELEQNDAWDGVYKRINLPRWNSRRSTRLALHYAAPGFPVIDVARSDTLNYPQAGIQTGDEGENITATVQYEPGKVAGGFGQRYFAQTVLESTRNYLAGTSSRNSRTTFSGYRELPLGALGSLVANYGFEEGSTAGPGEVRPANWNNTTYGLALNGSIATMPLGYGFGYSNFINESTGGTGYSRQERNFGMRYSSPAPPGKALNLAYSSTFVDYTNEPRGNGATSDETQTLAWDFKVNPRVNGQVNYTLFNHTDRENLTRPTEREGMVANMSYAIPGDRGSVSASYSQGIERLPHQGNESINTGMNITNQFRLGPRASMQIYYRKWYYDNRSGDLGLASGNDQLVAGCKYTIASDYGLYLDTTWEQSFTRFLTDYSPYTSTTTGTKIDVILTYQPPSTAWTYNLTINTRDDARTSDTNTGDNTYGSSNTITATVTYSF